MEIYVIGYITVYVEMRTTTIYTITRKVYLPIKENITELRLTARNVLFVEVLFTLIVTYTFHTII